MSIRTTAHAVSVSATLAVLLLWPSSVAAQQQRGGFVIGFGIGPGAVSLKPESGGVSGSRSNKLGGFTDLRIGYAPSEELSIYYSNQVVFFKLDDSSGDIFLNIFGVTGIGATYFPPTLSRLSLNGSVGIGTLGTIFDDATTDSSMGLGFTLGAGWALSDIAFLNVSLLYGKPGESGFDTQVLGLTASVALFSM
jgi:hypothetical protein